MNTLIKLLDNSITYIVIALFFVVLVISYAEARDTDIRKRWNDACVEMGGEPLMDVQRLRRGIGTSICLKPNSILTVPVYE